MDGGDLKSDSAGFDEYSSNIYLSYDNDGGKKIKKSAKPKK